MDFKISDDTKEFIKGTGLSTLLGVGTYFAVEKLLFPDPENFTGFLLAVIVFIIAQTHLILKNTDKRILNIK